MDFVKWMERLTDTGGDQMLSISDLDTVLEQIGENVKTAEGRRVIDALLEKGEYDRALLLAAYVVGATDEQLNLLFNSLTKEGVHHSMPEDNMWKLFGLAIRTSLIVDDMERRRSMFEQQQLHALTAKGVIPPMR